METEKLAAKKFILNNGIILGILSVLIGVIMYVTNSHTDPHWIYSVISGLVLIGVIVYAIKQYKAANGGYLTLGDALKVGIGTALIGGIISLIWSLLLANVIEPDYMAQVMEVQREKFIEQGLSEEQIETSIKMMEKFSGPLISSAFSIIGSLFFGFIVSLIGGLIMQKKKDVY